MLFSATVATIKSMKDVYLLLAGLATPTRGDLGSFALFMAEKCSVLPLQFFAIGPVRHPVGLRHLEQWYRCLANRGFLGVAFVLPVHLQLHRGAVLQLQQLRLRQLLSMDCILLGL
jgi:hypothetical protein